MTGLDRKSQARILEILAQFWQLSNLTFVIAMSDCKNALALGTRVALLKDGNLQQVDTPQNLSSHPANTFVSKFLHSEEE